MVCVVSELLLRFDLRESGVSGGTASGKTTVCDMIIQQLQDHRVVLVSQVSQIEFLVAIFCWLIIDKGIMNEIIEFAPCIVDF